jgi:hypothetical protein
MSTTKAVSANAVKNDGGTVVAGGTLSDSPMTKVLNVNELATGSEYGSKVVQNDGSGGEFTDPHGVIKAKSAGTGGLAYFPDANAGERNFIMRAAGDSASKVNNDSESLLNVPGAQYAGVGQPTIHKLLTTRKLGVTTYNILAVPSSGVVPGRTKGAGAGNLVTYVATTGNVAGTDDAASPTRSVPGELTYHFGALGEPTTDEYQAKDSYES